MGDVGDENPGVERLKGDGDKQKRRERTNESVGRDRKHTTR